MHYALYHPEFGYYSQLRPIGKKGDFYTSVSVSSLYGSLWAIQFEEIWQKMGSPPHFNILEQGAHNGQFALDVLHFIREHFPSFFEACVYSFIEPNSYFRQAQEEKLHAAGFMHHTKWIERIEDLSGWRGLFFSNELVDSFPTERMLFQNETWLQSFVTYNSLNHALEWIHKKPKNAELIAACTHLPRPLQDPFILELSMAARSWMHKICESMQEGVIITADYGFCSWLERLQSSPHGTLRTYQNHTVSTDILSRLGEVDITYHIDFESLVEEGKRLQVHPVCLDDQYHILSGLFEAFLKKIKNPEQKFIRAFQTLSHPTMMGTSFKYLIQQKAMPEPLQLHALRYARPLLSICHE